MRVRGGIRSVVEGVDFINLYLPHQKLKESLCPIQMSIPSIHLSGKNLYT